MSVDMLCFVLCFGSTFFGFRRGLAKEIFSLLALLLVTIFCVLYAQEFGEYIDVFEADSVFTFIIGALIIYCSVYCVRYLADIGIKVLVKDSFFSQIDKPLGLAFGFLRAMMILAIIFFFLNPLMDSQLWWGESFFVRALAYLEPNLSSSIAEYVEGVQLWLSEHIEY